MHCDDKCETDDAIIDNTGVQEKFEYLFEKSNLDQPIEQRSEQGGFITQDSNGDLGFIEFPDEWPRYPCGIAAPDNWVNSAPENTIALIHTHPFFEGDNIIPVCGEEYGTEDWSSGLGFDDWSALVDLANHLDDHSIKGYVIDGNNIVTYDYYSGLPTSPPPKIDERCGY